MPKLVALPVRGYPDIYVNPTRVTLIRESGETETLVEFEGDKREAIALPIEKVRTLIDQAMSTMATTHSVDRRADRPLYCNAGPSDEARKIAGRYRYERCAADGHE